MTYPPSIPKRLVTFGPAFVLEDGSVVAMEVTVKASRSLVWRQTGSPLITVAKTFTGPAGTEASLELPATDQPGWGDGNGGVIDVSGDQQTHLYTASIRYLHQGSTLGSVQVGPFALPLDDGSPVDIDDMIPVSGAPGVTVAIPDTWSAMLAAAQAAAEQAAQVGGAPTYANLPAGSTLTVLRGASGWPPRPTPRADVVVHWVGGTAATPPPGGLVDVDLWSRELA